MVVWSVDRIPLRDVTVGDWMLMAQPLQVTSVEIAGGSVTIRWADNGPGTLGGPADVIASVLRRRQMNPADYETWLLAQDRR